MKKIVVRTNCVVFFGSELGMSNHIEVSLLTYIAEDQDFVRSALHFPEDVFKAAEILRIFPRFIAP